VKTREIYTHVSNKSHLDRLFENRGDGRFIQRMYMRNIADIIPNGSDICSTADIPELGVIGLRRAEDMINKSNMM